AMILFAYLAIRNLFVQLPMLWWALKSEFAKNHQVYKIALLPGQLRLELRSTAVNILTDSLFLATVIKAHLAKLDESHLLSTALISFIWVEIWFYFSHRLMHTKALYFIHRLHHQAKVATPLTGMSFSILERLILSGGMAGGLWVVSKAYPISSAGVALYFVFNYFFALLQHSNVEVFSPQMRSLFFWLTTPSHHSMHHARMRGHYGLYTPFLDRLFKTEFADYARLQDLAYNGHGLTSLFNIAAPAPDLYAQILHGRRRLCDPVHAEQMQSPLVYEAAGVLEWLDARIAAMVSSEAEHTGGEWYLQRESQIFGPMTIEDLGQLRTKAAIRTGDICFSILENARIDLPRLTLQAKPRSASPIFFNRRNPRSLFQSVVTVVAQGTSSRAMTLDVSAQSASIYLKIPLGLGEQVGLEFMGTGNSSTLQTQAVVVSVYPHIDGYRCGLKFIKLERRAAIRWTAYIGNSRQAS
ncbi:MAG: sterol desaturase family protein, partial [Bdellovibrionales bacterium]